jgi:small neutral amino acid transporter SnatA (MarC family)
MLFNSFCMYIYMDFKEHNLKLWTLDMYPLTFKIIFLLTSFIFLNTFMLKIKAFQVSGTMESMDNLSFDRTI